MLSNTYLSSMEVVNGVEEACLKFYSLLENVSPTCFPKYKNKLRTYKQYKKLKDKFRKKY